MVPAYGSIADASASGDEGYVCGIARFDMSDLARGTTVMRKESVVVGHSTIRGAASLDWKKRPGNYMQAHSVLKVAVNCGAPLVQVRGAQLAEGPASCAIAALAQALVPLLSAPGLPGNGSRVA